jgi:hypothetical protein
MYQLGVFGGGDGGAGPEVVLLALWMPCGHSQVLYTYYGKKRPWARSRLARKLSRAPLAPFVSADT